jgi:hypothetical protein
MADLIRVDAHAHLYRTPKEGYAEKTGYEVWEYGEQADVHQTECVGTVDELLLQMESAEVSKAIIVNLFSAAVSRKNAVDALPGGLNEYEKEKRTADIDAWVRSEIISFNKWNCDLSQQYPELAAFVAADVNALPGRLCAEHITDMVQNQGAAGVKLHGAYQNFDMSDERLWPTYKVCQELNVPVIAHSGPDRQSRGFAEPRAFAKMLDSFPQLRVVIAHLGGGSWRQTLDIAKTYPNTFFDCCEIIAWTQSENGPTEQQLAQLIRDIGSSRVMMGSDFPWYDLDYSVDRVFSLPVLSMEEKERIIGANAVDILRL